MRVKYVIFFFFFATEQFKLLLPGIRNWYDKTHVNFVMWRLCETWTQVHHI